MRRITAAVALLILVLAVIPSTVRASLFFSEYVEGSSYNKALEVFNSGSTVADLTGYFIHIYTNGSTTPSRTIALSGMLAAGETFVVAHSSADAALLDLAGLVTGNCNFNGDDAIELFGLDATWDVIGQIGYDPGSFWGHDDLKTQDMTLLRDPAVLEGDPLGHDPFLLSQWISLSLDDFTNTGQHVSRAVPLPPGAWLLASGLLGIMGLGRLRCNAVAA